MLVCYYKDIVEAAGKEAGSDEYKDYLSRRGENNSAYYPVKIDASKLLIDNMNNTFVTPVFNGSASLRDAAGQLIESVTKSVRRKETVDSAYIEKLFDDTTSLYRLDQISASSEGKAQLGELPSTAVILLCSLAFAWICIIIYVCVSAVKRRKKINN